MFNNNLLVNWLKSAIRRRKLLRENEGLILGANADVRATKLGRFNFIAANSKVTDSDLGDYSYVANGTIIARSTIGKFCSIGSDVRIATGTHPTHMVSTHPIFYSTKFPTKNRFADKQYVDDMESIEIGHDVWIGARAMIFDGVRIGTGAIVAAGAIVAKDVEPYQIVGGVPAKPIRNRFDDETIAFLLQSKWWERDPLWIKENYLAFHDLDRFKSLSTEQDA